MITALDTRLAKLCCSGRSRLQDANISRNTSDDEKYRKLIRSLATKYASLRDCRGRWIKVSDIIIQSGVAGWVKGFVTYLLRVPEAVGLNCSCHAAQASKQGELPENMLQNLLLNLPPQTGIAKWSVSTFYWLLLEWFRLLWASYIFDQLSTIRNNSTD